MFRKLVISAMVLSCCVTGYGGENSEGKNLVENGDFAKVTETGLIPGWYSAKGVKQVNMKVEKVDGKNTLVLKGTWASVSQHIALKPAWKKLKLSMKMRTFDVKTGDANWKDARLAMTFKNAEGKRVGNWPRVFHAAGTTEWKACEREYEVPEGAVKLTITAANFGATGSVQFQGISFTVVE